MSDGLLRPGVAADIFKLQEIERNAASLFRGWPGIGTSALNSVIALSDPLHSIDQGLSIGMDGGGELVGFAVG
ncbi:MAG: hypothetical protein K9G83_09430, partial [Hyphomonadaceae bacterium]|nr:hypothetical protein [Hyphomonadaceae bacterium]